MKRSSSLMLVASLAFLTGCYHQVVQTGRAPSTTVIERPWTATWIFGIVPAEDISTAAQCPSGVATVVTEQSFLNGLVGVLTLGIYTPQNVTITCATGTAAHGDRREIRVGDGATLERRMSAIEEAIEIAEQTRQPVVVRY
jgi:hypothetical protein